MTNRGREKDHTLWSFWEEDSTGRVACKFCLNNLSRNATQCRRHTVFCKAMMGEKKEEHRVFCLGLTVQQIASFSDSEKERLVKLKAQVRTRLMFRPFGALPHSFRPVCLVGHARARSLRYVRSGRGRTT